MGVSRSSPRRKQNMAAPIINLDDWRMNRQQRKAAGEGLTLAKIREARDVMRRSGATFMLPMPGDGPWELQVFGDWLFAVSSTHGLYYLDEGTKWRVVSGVLGPETT